MLVDLAQMPVDGLDAQASQWALGGHQTLKTYLMLANPERAEPDFLAPQLVRHWQTEARITPGERDDLADRLLTFHAARVKAHPDWRIEARPELVAGARRTVLAVIGQRNAQDTIYRQVIDGIGNKYPDQTLVSLTPGTDARGLIRANALVPGAYTRQAYEGHVAEAIARGRQAHGSRQRLGAIRRQCPAVGQPEEPTGHASPPGISPTTPSSGSAS